MDDLYAHLGDLTPKLRENLATFEERARNNEKVMMLIRDVPLDFTLHDITLGGWNRSEIDAFFDRFEMNQMRTRFGQLMKEGLLGEAGATSSPLSEATEAKKVKTAKSLKVAKSLGEVLSSTTTPVVAYRHARAAVLDAEKGVVALCDLDAAIDAFARVAPCGHDLKALYREAASHERVMLEPADDTAIMAFLLDANSGRYDLAEVAQRFLGEPIVETSPSLFDSTTSDETLTYEVALVARLREHLHAEIAQWELNFVYEQIELPLVMVLGLMEARGIRVDVELLRTIAKEFTEEAASLDRQIQKVAGHEFKVNSPQQLQTVLFDEMGLTAVKKIKSGYSTDATSLEAIQDEHKIIALILRYREVEKLRGTYGAPLIDAVQSDSRIHATFHQMVARTGRLSSDGPNLHNIPVRSKEGRRLRYAFLPSEGWELAVSDYNQIELRILAHLSQDSGLLAAFASNEDVHRTIAASVFGCAPADVVAEQREQAKAVSYGLAYGMEAFGLSRRLGVPVSVAKEIMDKYFSGFPSLRAYMDQTIKDIRAKGYSRTEFGRIRPFPDIATATGPQRQAAERQAMNSGIQGLAADIFKSALVRLDRQLRAEDLQARLILQVHDEVVVESPPVEKERVEAVILDALTNAASLSVPLEVTLHWGENWAAAKG
jgi:DNA polymerase-1